MENVEDCDSGWLRNTGSCGGGGGTCSGQRGAEWKESIHEPLVRSGKEKGTKNEGVMSSHGPGWVMNTGGSGLAKCMWNK